MKFKKTFAAALVTSSYLVTGLATAATTVTFSPSATNGAQALALSADANFAAVGFQSNLSSSLVIANNVGSPTFSETGLIDITSFVNAANLTVPSGVGVGYHIFGNFTISGTGTWAGSTYTANPVGLSFSVVLTGDPGAIGGPVVNLGTATLAPGPAIAFAIAFGSVAPGASGTALTSLSADLSFTPIASAAGPGGFFQAPVPLNLSLSIGNAGGNSSNTGYTVAGGAGPNAVTFTTPLPGTNQGTANVTFNRQNVPEPGVLSLAGLALLGMALATKRKAVAAA